MTSYVTSSDIAVKSLPGVYRSRMSVYPGVAKARHKRYGDQAVKIVALALPILKEVLDLPPDLRIRLASLKGQWHGRYNSANKTAVVDYINTKVSTLEMLCHELVHAEQHHQGRLKVKRVAGQWVSLWHDEPVRASYRNRPYEKEAYARQVELRELVIQRVGIEKWCSI